MSKPVARLALLAWLAVILYLTLALFPNLGAAPNLIPFRMIARDLAHRDKDFYLNFLGNLAGFLPLGYLLPLARDRPTTFGMTALAGAALSAAIEVTQYQGGMRLADVDDVLLNTVGTALGYALLRARRSAPEAPAAAPPSGTRSAT